MFKIQTLNTIADIGLNQFPVNLYQISSEINDPDAILVRSMDMLSTEFLANLKVVGRAGTGTNNIPISRFTPLGIPVLNAVGANANAVRELVIAGMLLASRNICQAWDYVRQLENDHAQMEAKIEKEKKQFSGFELMGKTLGVVGLGSIGVKVANAAMNLGMHVVGYDPTITVNRAWELSAGVQQAQNIEMVLKESDFITFHVPLNKETKNMITSDRLNLMKDNVIILNFARDGIIDNSALAHFIKIKKVCSYVTDFPTPELKNLPQVISLPHLGASTKEAEDNCAVMIVKQVREYLENGNIISSVNFPTIEMPINKHCFRLAIVNANVPNIVAQISSKLAASSLNIVSLLNGSKEDIAYTLVDLNAEITDALLKEISAIPGIIRVRRVFC